MTPEIADGIIAITMTRGGGTFDRRGALIEREKGFVVGMSQGSSAILRLEDLDLAYDAIKGILDTYKSMFIGTWLYNGEIYIDPVLITENREEAEQLGRLQGQKAIYSFEKGEIFL